MIKRKEQNLTLENFEGPLDLLLHLIRKKKLDILEVSLVEVADQYIDFVHSQDVINLDETSDYLLLASQLIDIKTKSLMKNDIFLEKDLYEDEKENLLERLIAYEKFKLLSEGLNEVYEGASRFEKLEDDFIPFVEMEGERITKLVSKGRKDLERAMRNIMISLENKEGRQTTLRVKRMSAEQIKAGLVEKLDEGDTTFISILSNNTYYYIALALLVLLEMSKNGEITLIQKDDFSDIEVRRIHGK
ncbi:segregation and condensation protein A-like [Oratosquilla oratoria]|uniref:segregation and condensation protein A-like n=1 Tax=Oratosquilla oratoria TaxID=337810 RepID=UPI003F75C77F